MTAATKYWREVSDTVAISREDVDHVAYLARLGLTEEEKAHFQEQLSDRKSTRLNSSHIQKSRMPSSA